MPLDERRGNSLRHLYRGAASRAAAVEPLERRTLLSVEPLDLSFGTRGFATAEFFGSNTDGVRAVAVMPDGKVVAGGSTTLSTGAIKVALARYNADGSLDATFGQGGRLVDPFNGFGSSVIALAAQPDGKLLVLGPGLLRLNPDGSLDTTFDGDGQAESVHLPLLMQAMALGPGGSIVVAGENADDLMVARYRPDGRLDPAFSGDGIGAPVDFNGRKDGARAVAVYPDGRVAAAGYATKAATTEEDFAVARFGADGSPDLSFGAGGKVVTDFENANDRATALAVAPDGKLVAAGDSGARGRTGVLARYDDAGNLDASFGQGGRYFPAFRTTEYYRGVRVLAGGKVVTLGKDWNTRDFAVERLAADATPDATFGGGDGRVTTSFGNSGGPDAMDLSPDGRIVAAGATVDSVQKGNFAVARYTPDGEPDVTFDGDGKATTDFPGPGSSEATALAVRADGKLLMAVRGGTAHLPVVRFNADGTFDTTFGPDRNGLATFPGLTPAGAPVAWAVAEAPGGKVVVAGERLTDFVVARYNDNGTPDTTFGTGGVVHTDLPFGDTGADDGDAAFAVAVQPDGKIVAAGRDGKSWGLVRYNADGALDATFGNGGRAVVGIEAASGGGVRDLALQPDGKIVAVGLIATGGSSPDAWCVARFLPDGMPDPAFDGDGRAVIVTPPAAGGFSPVARAVVVRPGGGILVGGNQQEGEFAVVALNADGSPNASFGGGRVLTAFPLGRSSIYDMALRSDGVSVALGQVTTGGGVKTGMAAYLPDGSLFHSFGTDGKFTAAALFNGTALAVRGDDRVVAAGKGLRDAALARFHGGPAVGVTVESRVTTELADVPGHSTLGSFAVHRSGDTSQPLTVPVTLGGAAENGVDYERIPPTVTIPAGADSVVVPVRPIDDFLFEADETVELRLEEEVPGYALSTSSFATVTIRDNETADRFEQNNSFTAARQLNVVTRQVHPGLSVPFGDQDFFLFSAATGTDLVVEALFQHARGDLGLELYDGSQTLVDASRTAGDGERLALRVPGAAGGSRFYYARVFGEGGAVNPDYTLILETAPAVTAAAADVQDRRTLRFTFSRPIDASTLGPSDLQLVTQPGGAPTGGTPEVSYDPATRTASFTYPNPLPNGNYRATLAAPGITDAAGTALASAQTLDFFVLAGDINRDRRVDGTDFATLAGNFGKTGMTYDKGDLNGDGRVDAADFALLAGNFGKTVPAPQPSPIAAAATSRPAPTATAPTGTVQAAPHPVTRHPPVRRRAVAPRRGGLAVNAGVVARRTV